MARRSTNLLVAERFWEGLSDKIRQGELGSQLLSERVTSLKVSPEIKKCNNDIQKISNLLLMWYSNLSSVVDFSNHK